VGPDPGVERPLLKASLEDCAESLSPAGTKPSLSTYWVDQLLAGLSPGGPTEVVIADGNAWSLERRGDLVIASSQYAEEGDDVESVSVDELVAALTEYRDVIRQTIESGHRLDERSWAQRNPVG
jgi:hypothetical protein